MKTKIIVLACILTMLTFISPVIGQVVTKQEAATIAQNWINMVIDRYGSWGGEPKASIMPIITLEKEGRKLGYFCSVKPKGFILVSLRKELAPVKLYSELGTYSNSDVDCFPDLFFDIPTRIINAIEAKSAPIDVVSSAELKEILEIDYSETWDQVYNYIPGTYKGKTKGSSGKDTYQEGDTLLTSNWHQKHPYNDNCPVMDPPCSNINGRAKVGCVATAGAQIMNYWSWPPYGVGEPFNDPYDWPNILDTVTALSSTIEIEAVAELCAEVGEAVDMAYGCDISNAFTLCPFLPPVCDPTHDLETRLMSTFRFAPSVTLFRRGDYNTTDWFNMIKVQINALQPIVYDIRIDLLYGGHVVVVDGWRENGALKEYHINFGWGGGNSSNPCWTWVPNSNMWYTLDAIPCYYDDFMIVNIVPETAIGSVVMGEYTIQPTFPYRYFNTDASGYNAVFNAGQNLQFLPGVSVTGIASSESPVGFYGTNINNLHLFTRGDISNGIRLRNGEIELTNSGSIKFH